MLRVFFYSEIRTILLVGTVRTYIVSVMIHDRPLPGSWIQNSPYKIRHPFQDIKISWVKMQEGWHRYWDAHLFDVLLPRKKCSCGDICCGFGAWLCACAHFTVNFWISQIMPTFNFDRIYVNYVCTFYMRHNW